MTKHYQTTHCVTVPETANALPPLPEPFDYCYEWDGPFGSREFSYRERNGRKPDRSVRIFTADQMLAYGAACAAAERERMRQECIDIVDRNGGSIEIVAAIRSATPPTHTPPPDGIDPMVSPMLDVGPE